MSEVILNAVVRNETGGAMNRLRYADKIPGVYYAHGEKNINITATPLAMKPLIYTTNTHLINLKLDNGENKTCILRDVQFDPITDRPVHFDLQGVKENEELTVLIPVVLNGSPKGVKDGGTIQHIMHKVRVSCLPKFIPEQIILDISDLGMNDSIHVRDIKIENVRVLDNAASAVVAVVPPTVVKEEVAAVPGVTPEAVAGAVVTAAEPEVIAKGKKPVEGEAAPAKK
jgi:large subunit ribosomal protein L25